MTLAPGSRIGPYELTALIGEGGMGKVWRAHHTAQWAKSGRELFYGGLDGAMMSVPVETTPTFSFGKAAKLFQWPTLAVPGLARTYDVSRDGKRFLMVKANDERGDGRSPSSSIVVVVNWLQELRARTVSR